ncbi:MAG: LuxR C-terminal-related transcriptional regulator [Burkholderiaceae bacterium]|jgi:DNA-binding CsgD family transcriptional regulator
MKRIITNSLVRFRRRAKKDRFSGKKPQDTVWPQREGHVPYDRKAGLKALKSQVIAIRKRAKRLTPKELDCLRWVAIGKTSWEISQVIKRSETTINSHIVSACKKLEIRGRHNAALMLVRAGAL